MKRMSKLLVVLLCLAVITATLVIVASASSNNVAKIGEKEYETFEEALDAAASGEEIVLIDNVSIDSPYRVDKDITINLNGKTIDACNNAFTVIGGFNFTVKGEGNITSANIFISTDKNSEAAPTVVFDGSGYGINVSADAGVFTSSKSGTLKFKNLTVEAFSTPGNRGVFHNDAKSDARLEFAAVEVIAMENQTNYSSIVNMGAETSVKLSYCSFITNRVVFGMNNCSGTHLAIEADNCYFSAAAKSTSGKLHEIGVFGTYAVISCQIILNNTVVEGSFRPVCVNATSAAMITLNNSAIKNNGVQGYDIVRTCNIRVNSGSMLTTVSTTDNIIHANSEADGTFIILMEGARMNKNVYNLLYVKNKTTGIRYGVASIDENGEEALTLETLPDNANFTVIYDPAGNAEAPYVVVRRTYGDDGVETTPKGASESHVVYSNSYAGFPVGGVIWENGKSGPFDVAGGKPNSSFLGWNKNGIISGEHFGGNGALRYTFDEPNADGMNGTTLMFSDGKNLAHNAYQVFVAEADIAFDSELFAQGTLSMCARGASNGGNYSSGEKISITEEGKAAFGDKTVDLKHGEWNRVTIVVYSDMTTVGTSNKGKAYYYVNGELIGTGNGYNILTSNGDIAYLWGFRYDANANNQVGATILFDNTYFAAYETYNGNSSDDPLSYSASAGQAVSTGKVNSNITVGGLPMGNLNDALTVGNELGVYPQLKGDVINQKITVNGTVRTNGYSIVLLDGSNAAIVKYDEKNTPRTYEFNSKYNSLGVKYQWFVGNKNNVADLKNPAMYVETTVPLGNIPEYQGEELPTGTKHIGQDIYISSHVGWSIDLDAQEPDTFGAVSVSDAVNMADSAVKVFPVYEKEYTKVTGYKMIILDVNGNFSRGINPNNDIYGSDWTTRAGKAIKLDYGETLVLMSSSFRFIGAFNSLRQNTENPKTFAIDLNGHTMNINGNKNSTGKIPNYFPIKTGETMYFYSSVPGATVNVESTNEGVTAANGGRLFNILGSGSNNIADNISDSTNHNTHLKLGTVTRFGETYPGSNLTICGDTLIELSNGDKTCSAEIEGITFVKTINAYGAVVVNNYFNGNVTVKNSNFFFPNGGPFIDGKNFGITDVNGDGKKDKNDVGVAGEVRVAANATIDSCYLFTASNGTSDVKGNLSGGDYTFKSILYQNCVTNGRIGGSNTGLAIRIGDNCLVYTPSATRIEGVDKYTYNRNMTFGNYTVGDTVTFKYVSSISGSGTGAKYNYSEFTYALMGSEASANIVLPYFQYKFVSEENKFNVSFVDGNGAVIKTEAYAKGALPMYPTDVEDLTGGVSLSKTFNGSFSPDLPEGVNAEVTLTANYDVTETVNGIKANISLDQNFIINLMIPVIYKDYVTGVKVGDTALVITETEEYLKVSVPVFAKDASKVISFVISISEQGTDLTKTVDYSIAQYAEQILKNEESKYTASDRKLVWYVVNYAAEAALYFGGEADEALGSLLETYADAKGEATERVYAGVIENHGISEIFSAATVKLTEAPAYTFTVKAGFAGTVTVTTTSGTYTFTVEASEAPERIVIEGMKAYELAQTAVITAEGTIGETAVVIDSGSYNLATFANYHSQNAANSTASANALALINALYDYVTEANIYAGSK